MEIKINGLVFEGSQVQLDETADKKQIAFSFDVTSETYHDVTTLLYKNDFQVDIPEKSLSFPATIQEYSTSTTNLYEKGNTSEFYLKLREKYMGGEYDTMEPILLRFPDQFETERLIIRAPKPEDWQPIYKAMQASINELKPWLPFARQKQTEIGVQKTTKEAYLNFLSREDLRFHAFDKESGEFIVSTGLHRINWDVRKFEIGYWIDTKCSGKGYVTELVKGLTSFAFRELDANRVEIRCDTKNGRSKAVAERAGFELEGILRNDREENGELRDTCVFAVIEDPETD